MQNGVNCINSASRGRSAHFQLTIDEKKLLLEHSTRLDDELELIARLARQVPTRMLSRYIIMDYYILSRLDYLFLNVRYYYTILYNFNNIWIMIGETLKKSQLGILPPLSHVRCSCRARFEITSMSAHIQLIRSHRIVLFYFVYVY